MKKNNSGFIAISLIYSFFLVFLMVLLVILNNYAQNRLLLNDVKKETQEYLNNLAEFNPVSLAQKKDGSGHNINYSSGEEVMYASDTWVVVEDKGIEAKLVLKRFLNAEELNLALTNEGIPGAQLSNTTLMCLNNYRATICNYENNVTYNYYRWNNSIARIIVNYWLENNAILQKAIATGYLQEQNFSDGLESYVGYIRIPNSLYDASINDPNAWYMNAGTRLNGISYINTSVGSIEAHTTYKGIRPVIVVKKAS